MGGIDAVVKPNVALREAGLLAQDAAGRIDLARTRAVYFTGNSGFVLINRADREGGVVKPAEDGGRAARGGGRPPVHPRSADEPLAR